jgi:large subunit ribosomal protein L18
MKTGIKEKRKRAELRARRSKARIRGTAQRPRLSIKRSLKHIYVQLIDDTMSRTLVSASDAKLDKTGKPIEKAGEVGKLLAQQAKSIGIEQAVFDRGAYRYHGRVAALVEAARGAGMKI